MIRIPIVNRFTCNKTQLPIMIKQLYNNKTPPILDYINESNKYPHKNFNEIIRLIKTYPGNKIAIKLSSLDVKKNYENTLNLSNKICQEAKLKDCKIMIDAEDYLIQDYISYLTDELMSFYNNEEVLVYKTYQMYRKDSLEMLESDISKKNRNYIGCKLVRGAYYNQDKKYDILFKEKKQTDINYNLAIDFLRENTLQKDKVILATHNDYSVDLSLKKPNNFEYSQLLGMNDKLTNKLIKNNKKVYKYLPYGNFLESLPYLVRRLYENYSILKWIN